MPSSFASRLGDDGLRTADGNGNYNCGFGRVPRDEARPRYPCGRASSRGPGCGRSRARYNCAQLRRAPGDSARAPPPDAHPPLSRTPPARVSPLRARIPHAFSLAQIPSTPRRGAIHRARPRSPAHRHLAARTPNPVSLPMPRRTLTLARSSPVPLPKTPGRGTSLGQQPLAHVRVQRGSRSSRSQPKRTDARLLTRAVPSPEVGRGWTPPLGGRVRAPAEPSGAHRTSLRTSR